MDQESRSAFEVPAQFGPGSRIAGYVIEEQIGQGGMAVVFRAHDDRLDRTVALKILAPALAADDAFRQRFIRESRAAAAVDDPHVIPVFEAGEASDVLFIAMRFVRGGDVGSLALAGDLPPVARVAAIVAQVASALDAAHAGGLVHRDVKPANMLLDARTAADRPDHVYLSDFGLSKLALQTTGLTDTGTFLGTLDYIAPEQIDGRAVDGRADQYSLGCTAFELLTGRPPFRRNEAMAVMYAQLSEPPPALTEFRPDLPPAVDAVLARALAKLPDQRYPTCREFAVALALALGVREAESPGRPSATTSHPAAVRFLSMAETSAGPGDMPTVHPSPLAAASRPSLWPIPNQLPVPEPTRRRVLPLVLLASILVAGAIVGVAFVLRSPGSSPSAGPVGRGPLGSGQPGSGRIGYRLAGTLDPGAPGSISAVGWNHTGTLVATSDKNGTTYLWSVATSRRAGPLLSGPGKAYATSFSPDGTELATGFSTGTTYLWNLLTGRLLATLPDPGPPAGKEVDSLAFSPDGTMLAAGDGNGYTNLWHLVAGAHGARLIASLPDPAGAGVFSVAFSDPGTLATGDYSGHVDVWDVASGTTTSSFALPGGPCSTLCAAVSALAFSGDGSLLAAANESGSAEIWSVAQSTGSPMQVPATAAGQAVWAISFSGSDLLAMADDDGQSFLYRVAESRLTSSFAGALADPSFGQQGVGALAFSPNGRYLVTGDTSGRAYLWRAG
jgi:serine/threonine protein kinase